MAIALRATAGNRDASWCSVVTPERVEDGETYEVKVTPKKALPADCQEVRIPWSEIPGSAPARGATFGCNLTLFDADGGLGRGRMVWGAELGDTAVGCGVVTLLP